MSETKALDNTPDLPDDYKIESDRLVHDMEPMATRIAEIMQELPRKTNTMTIEYNGFTLTIDLTPPTQ